MSVSVHQLVEKFPDLIRLEREGQNVQISGLNSPDLAQASDLIFISDLKHLEKALGTKSRIWLVAKKLATKAPDNVTLLISEAVTLCMALVGKTFFPSNSHKQPWLGEKIHSTAIIHPTAQIGEGTIIGPYAVVGEGARIGENCIIGSQTTIEPFAELGPRCHIHPQVFIAHHCVLGADCEVHPQTSIGTEGFGYVPDAQGRFHRFTHYGRVVLGERVHIGAGVNIDRGTFGDTHIGENCIIDNHCHFAHNTKVGAGTIITAGFIIGGSSTIGRRCVFGGRTSVNGHLEITDNCTFAGVTTVNSSITEPGAYGGYPAEPLTASRRTLASLPHVPKLRRQVAMIMKKLGLTDEDNT